MHTAAAKYSLSYLPYTYKSLWPTERPNHDDTLQSPPTRTLTASVCIWSHAVRDHRRRQSARGVVDDLKLPSTPLLSDTGPGHLPLNLFRQELSLDYTRRCRRRRQIQNENDQRRRAATTTNNN